MARLEVCPICQLEYVAGHPEDEREHALRHRRWLTAVRTLLYNPIGRIEQEEQKDVGYRLMQSGESLAERVRGAELVIRARFDRSLANSMRGSAWRKHPTFEKYAAMVEGFDFAPDVKTELRRRYGVRPGVIPYGHSYWAPGSRQVAYPRPEQARR